MEPVKGHSVAFPQRWWYPACRSGDLGRTPLSVELMETPLVVYRDDGGVPRALVDRCPHRNFPLSEGRVTQHGTLQCGYHGWTFDGGGECVEVPGLLRGSEARAAARSVPTHEAREQDGFVWIWGERGGRPDKDPFGLPEITGRGSGETVFTVDVDSTLHSALENALDVPHTAFLHAGRFRGSEPEAIEAIRRPIPDGIETEYLGEPVRMGPLRLPRRWERTFDHWDRFHLPSIAQVEYRVEGLLRIVNTILHLPMAPLRTRAWFVLRYWSRLPGPVGRAIVRLRGRGILADDVGVLRTQTRNIRRFGGERFTSTDLDIMGNAIWRELRRAEKAETASSGNGGQPPGSDMDERSITFRI